MRGVVLGGISICFGCVWVSGCVGECVCHQNECVPWLLGCRTGVRALSLKKGMGWMDGWMDGEKRARGRPTSTFFFTGKPNHRCSACKGAHTRTHPTPSLPDWASAERELYGFFLSPSSFFNLTCPVSPPLSSPTPSKAMSLPAGRFERPRK